MALDLHNAGRPGKWCSKSCILVPHAVIHDSFPWAAIAKPAAYMLMHPGQYDHLQNHCAAATHPIEGSILRDREDGGVRVRELGDVDGAALRTESWPQAAQVTATRSWVLGASCFGACAPALMLPITCVHKHRLHVIYYSWHFNGLWGSGACDPAPMLAIVCKITHTL
eukprot:scaffold55412_cov19-Tisochrysis_lutea.AAC.2